MRNQRQGVRSTKPKRLSDPFLPAPVGEITENKCSPECRTSVSAAQNCDQFNLVPAIEKKKDIFIATYNPRETMLANQTGKFPQSSSQGNNYQMVIHEINGHSTGVEPMKNRTKGKIILARRCTLARMKFQGIVRKHQVLNNKISAAYKTEI